MFSSSPSPPNCNWTGAGIGGGTLSQSASINTTYQAGPGAPVLNYSASAQGSVAPGVMHLQSMSNGSAAARRMDGPT